MIINLCVLVAINMKCLKKLLSAHRAQINVVTISIYMLIKSLVACNIIVIKCN
jgi:hypothetical protein